MICELCGKEVEKLHSMLYAYEEDKMLCKECWNREADRGDMYYEMHKEED